MKNLLILCTVFIICSCTNLTYQEQQTLRSLKANGISTEHAIGGWEAPASPLSAGLLNLLPGIGNFYLASGNAGQSEHYLYGTLNLITWPFSILWGIPEAVVDSRHINERELVYFYTYDEMGQQALKDKNLKLNNRGMVEKIQ